MRVRAQWNCVKRSLKIDRSVINAVTNSSYTLLGGWASDLAHPSRSSVWNHNTNTVPTLWTYVTLNFIVLRVSFQQSLSKSILDHY